MRLRAEGSKVRQHFRGSGNISRAEFGRALGYAGIELPTWQEELFYSSLVRLMTTHH